MADRLTPTSRTLPDTDWRVDELYDFAGNLGATVLKANYSRYVADLNRPPDGASLYPGRLVTDVCPLELFIYQCFGLSTSSSIACGPRWPG